MKKFNLALAFGLSLSTFTAFADNEVILVSDIDDTIKVSHVLDPDSTIANAFLPKNTFMGMPQLYSTLLKDKKIDEVVYLSNAPKALMYPFHRNFLNKMGFPSGRLLLNGGLSNKHHKVNSIRNLIEKENPKELILVGDNGEKDTLVYGQIQKEFPSLKITTFIHLAYSSIGFHRNFGKQLEENQIGFATSLDLSAQLLSRGLMTEKGHADLLTEIVPDALKEGNYKERRKPIMFPAWFDCRDFKPVPVGNDDMDKKIAERCSVEPYDN